jgi:methylthioribose-1-phosphate isomerase
VEPIRAVQWSPDGTALRIIDQRRLPGGLITGVITDKRVYRPPYSFTYEMRSRD